MLQNQYVHVNPSEQMFYLTVHTQSLTCIQLFLTPWAVTCQTPQSMGFPRQEYWSRLPFPPPWVSS